MITLYLIRHSMTEGNLHHRYIGVTDEPLCGEGRRLAESKQYKRAEVLFVSPRIRCVQTAEILFPGQEQHVIEEFAECDFGIFENKNAQELEDCPAYSEWISTMGRMQFPGGESKEHFLERCIVGMDQVVAYLQEHHLHSAALVVHGGTVMNLMERFGVPHKEFYEWHLDNAQCLKVETDIAAWQEGNQKLRLCE